MPDPKKKPTLPFWQQHLSKLDANKDGITSGREILLGAKQGFKAWRNIASNIGAPGTISGSNISTGAKVIKNNASTIGHTVLDLAGAAPLVGAPADAINASWYASEGDTTNAALSSAAIIPGGQLVTGGKYVAKLRKVFGFGKNASKNVPNPKSPVTETSFKSKNTTPLKELPHEGLINSEKLTSVINRSKSKGVIYDKNLSGNFNWTSKMFRRMPDVSGRRMVDVNPGGGIPPQRFYESTGLAGKKLPDGSTSKGTWVPLEGFGTNNGIKDWFIKTKGWDKGYGSEVMKNMGTHIKKMGY